MPVLPEEVFLIPHLVDTGRYSEAVDRFRQLVRGIEPVAYVGYTIYRAGSGEPAGARIDISFFFDPNTYYEIDGDEVALDYVYVDLPSFLVAVEGKMYLDDAGVVETINEVLEGKPYYANIIHDYACYSDRFGAKCIFYISSDADRICEHSDAEPCRFIRDEIFAEKVLKVESVCVTSVRFDWEGNVVVGFDDCSQDDFWVLYKRLVARDVEYMPDEDYDVFTEAYMSRLSDWMKEITGYDFKCSERDFDLGPYFVIFSCVHEPGGSTDRRFKEVIRLLEKLREL